MIECYECGQLAAPLSPRSRCATCEHRHAMVNEKENDRLREASQAVVDTARRAKSQQVTYHYLPEIDNLAAVLEGVG